MSIVPQQSASRFASLPVLTSFRRGRRSGALSIVRAPIGTGSASRIE